MTESQPYTKDFVVVSRVSWGRPNLVCLNVFSDKTSDTAPLAKNHNVNTLCIVEADLSHIPDKDIPRRQGVDGMMYYVVECQVEIRCKLDTTSRSHFMTVVSKRVRQTYQVLTETRDQMIRLLQLTRWCTMVSDRSNTHGAHSNNKGILTTSQAANTILSLRSLSEEYKAAGHRPGWPVISGCWATLR